MSCDRAAWLVAFALVTVVSESPAVERTRNRDGLAVRWTQQEVVLRLDTPRGPASSPSRRRHERLRAALESAVEAWKLDCATLTLSLGAPTRLRGAEQDGHNAVVVLGNEWCRNGRRREGCYDPRKLAVTTTYLTEATAIETTTAEAAAIETTTTEARAIEKTERGAMSLVEADIEVNGVHFDWLGDRPHLRKPPVSLETLLVHELGHALGLEDVHDDQSEDIMARPHNSEHGPLGPSDEERSLLCELYPRPEPRLMATSTWLGAFGLGLVLLAGLLHRVRQRRRACVK